MREDLPDLSQLCHVCGGPASKWIARDPYCMRHALEALDAEGKTRRFSVSLGRVSRDPWWVERWYRCDLPRVELAEASDRLLVEEGMERVGWKVWAVYTIVYVRPHKPSYAAELVGVDRRTVWRWRKEYHAGGLGKLIK